ncbi:MAG: UDP-N-acetylmuramoyl-L-alanyl-D-glutamate--2,6-diaminopimelate ligase [Puniceicoccales bacterium]|jgi:UDP-N-acetylmuramoyl-L-alanyl-D-glutamate--2,6-diaminopimelate ligase|nr:UDP-N-acetylmuramoyl-L-alanyl-D-glutamate--2,6-diaminopimelate ligase [Puniceicoccales bacterium]
MAIIANYPLDKILEWTGSGNVTCDSRKIKAGDIFFLLPGRSHREHIYCQEALNRGCSGIVIEENEIENFHEIFACQATNIPLLTTENIYQKFVCTLKKSLNLLENSHPTFAVTGTNGKTTITYLLRHLLDIPTAVMGTIQYDLLEKVIPSTQTTPNLEDLYRMIAILPKSAALAIELSSHALDQRRVYGLDIDGAIFSNLTGDHLDYHGDTEHYFLAKRKLFSGENGNMPRHSIINLNDAYGQRLYRELGGVTYGIENTSAHYNAVDLRFFPDKIIFTLVHGEEKYFCEIPLIGAFNVENGLAALAAIHESRSIELEHLIEKIKTFPGVPGRLQHVENDQEITILVDYAHTEDGLRKVLESLQMMKRRQMLTVFGCGGDRDRTKRPKMMNVACQFSDLVFVTSDNPRHESMKAIFEDMKPGILYKSCVMFEPDRRKAIALALKKAQKGDIVLVAGKGHETYQQIGDEKLPFSDIDTVKALLPKGI